MALSWFNVFKIWIAAAALTLVFSIPILGVLFLTTIPFGAIVSFFGLSLEFATNLGLVLGYMAITFSSIIALKIALLKIKPS